MNKNVARQNKNLKILFFRLFTFNQVCNVEYSWMDPNSWIESAFIIQNDLCTSITNRYDEDRSFF